MKMSEYEDYMKLLFDKYLAKPVAIIFIISFIVVMIALSTGGISTGSSLEFIAVLLLPLVWYGVYYVVTRAIIYWPGKIYNILIRVFKTVIEDIDDIQKKHEGEADEKHN